MLYEMKGHLFKMILFSLVLIIILPQILAPPPFGQKFTFSTTSYCYLYDILLLSLRHPTTIS